MGFGDLVSLEDSPNAFIPITEAEEVSFNQTGNMDDTLHQDYQYIGKVSHKILN